jgi:hypothetical protein
MFLRGALLLRRRTASAKAAAAAAALAAQGARGFSDMVDRASLNPRGESLHALRLSCELQQGAR